MTKKIEVCYVQWHLLRLTVEGMQNRTFYIEDEEGVLRRWYPPRPPVQKGGET